MRNQTETSDALSYTLRYAERGIRVFPVQPGGKGPYHRLIDSWKEEATTDRDQIRNWFGRNPTPNVGIATGEWEGDGELFVPDIDVPGGFETWDRLRAEQDTPVPETTAVTTPSGGAHLYFVAPAGVTIKSATDNLGESVDTKGHGGYVVAPPSKTDEGAYSFRDDAEGFAQAPFWLVSAVAKETEQTNQERMAAPSTDYDGEVSSETVEDALNAIPEQPGYEKWIRIIAAVKDGAETEAEAERMLERWSPENQNGDYTYSERLKNAADDEINVGTLFYYAEQEGWTHPAKREDRSSAQGSAGGDGQAGKQPEKPHPADMPPSNLDDHAARNGQKEEAEISLEDFRIESVPELLAADLQPPQPLITYDGRALLHEGTSQLVAKPKIGKTNLAMNLGLAVASENGVALGNATVQRHGGVLMLNLDGSRRGSYGRFQTMCADGEAPGRFDVLHGQFPEVAPDEDGGALDILGEYLQEKPDTELVVVDTLQHLRPTSDGRRNVYHEDYDFVHPIARLGRDTETSILLVHHLNKLDNGDELDKVSGSTGLTGAVENVMILDRARGESKATLSVRPREGQEEDFDLEFNGHVLTWCVGTGGYEPSSGAREQVWRLLSGVERSMKVQEIAERLDKKPNTVTKTLRRMIDNGAPVTPVTDGEYRAVSGET